jgi:hypothetical protein
VRLAFEDFPYTVSLTADDHNRFSLRAVDEAGNLSDEAIAIVEEDSRRPERPTDVVPEEGNETVLVSWTPPFDDGTGNNDAADIVGYLVYYGTDGDSDKPTSGAIAAQGPSPVFTSNPSSFRLTGLTNGVTIFVNVTSVDEIWLSETDPLIKDEHESPADSNQPRRAQPGLVTPRVAWCSAFEDFSSGSPASVVLDQGFAYVGLSGGGIVAYDVSDPANVAVVGTASLSSSGNVTALAKQGRFLYALSGNEQALSTSNQLAIIDTSLLDIDANPVMAVLYESGAAQLSNATVNGIHVNGQTLSLSVGNPQSSTFRGWIEQYDLFMSESLTTLSPSFLASSQSNVSSAALYVSSNKLGGGAPLVLRADGIGFSLMGNAMQALNHAEVTTPKACRTDTADGTCPGALSLTSSDRGTAVFASGTDVISVSYGGMRIYDATNPYALSERAGIGLASTGNGGTYANGIVYAATQGEGLEMIDVTDRTSPQSLGTSLTTCPGQAFSASGNYLDVSMQGTMAAIAANEGDGDLRVVHVADPGSFEKLGSSIIESVAGTPVLAVSQDIAVIGGQNTYTTVFDISDPRSLVKTALYGPGGLPEWRMNDAAFLGSYMVGVGASSEWLRVMSFADPTSPTVHGSLTTGCVGTCSGLAVAVSDGFAYVTVKDDTVTDTYSVRPIRVGDAMDLRAATAFTATDIFPALTFASVDDVPMQLYAHRGRLYGLSEEGLKIMSLTPAAVSGATGFRLIASEASDAANLAPISGSEFPQALTGSGRYLFAQWGGSVTTWDVSKADAPVRLKVARSDGVSQGGEDTELFVSGSAGDLVYSGGYLMTGYDVYEMERTAPDTVTFGQISERSGGSQGGMHVAGPYMFVAGGSMEAYKLE